jgi:hypothetical protein
MAAGRRVAAEEVGDEILPPTFSKPVPTTPELVKAPEWRNASALAALLRLRVEESSGPLHLARESLCNSMIHNRRLSASDFFCDVVRRVRDTGAVWTPSFVLCR